MGHIRNSLLKLGLCSFFPSEIGFVFHFSYLAYRISHLVFRGGANVSTETGPLGAGSGAPNIGGGCAFDAKKVLDSGFAMLVTRF